MVKVNYDIRWLINLRWLGVCFFFVFFLVSRFFLKAELPYFYLFVCTFSIFSSNLILFFLSNKEFGQGFIAAILVFDTSFLALILGLTGGSSNPFSTLFLVHITLAALVLGRVWTYLIALYSSFCFLLLFFFYLPLPAFQHDHQRHQAAKIDQGLFYNYHLMGMLISFILTAALVTFFLTRISKQLASLEAQKFNQLRFASLASLATGAAHELGSPLASIAIASEELEHCLREAEVDRNYAIENAETIRVEAFRCKDILLQMGGEMLSLDVASVEHFLIEDFVLDLETEAAKRFSLGNFSFNLEARGEVFAPRKMLFGALFEILKNAKEAAGERKVSVCVKKERERLVFIVENYIESRFAKDIERFKEPFFSTKEVGRGMGLGLFLVDLFVQSIQGSFEMELVSPNKIRTLLEIKNA